MCGNGGKSAGAEQRMENHQAGPDDAAEVIDGDEGKGVETQVADLIDGAGDLHSHHMHTGGTRGG